MNRWLSTNPARGVSTECLSAGRGHRGCQSWKQELLYKSDTVFVLTFSLLSQIVMIDLENCGWQVQITKRFQNSVLKGEKKPRKPSHNEKRGKNSITGLTKDRLGKHHFLHTYNVILCLCLAFVTTGQIDLSIIIATTHVILFHGFTQYLYQELKLRYKSTYSVCLRHLSYFQHWQEKW